MDRIGVTREPLSLGGLNKVLFFTILYNVFTEKVPLSYCFYWLLNRNRSQDQNVFSTFWAINSSVSPFWVLLQILMTDFHILLTYFNYWNPYPFKVQGLSLFRTIQVDTV